MSKQMTPSVSAIPTVSGIFGATMLDACAGMLAPGWF
jgi:hypothetical protein